MLNLSLHYDLYNLWDNLYLSYNLKSSCNVGICDPETVLIRKPAIELGSILSQVCSDDLLDTAAPLQAAF